MIGGLSILFHESRGSSATATMDSNSKINGIIIQSRLPSSTNKQISSVVRTSVFCMKLYFAAM